VISVEPWVTPELLDERAASIVANRINSAGTAISGPGYLSFLNNNGFPSTLAPDIIDITDQGIDKGVVPVPAGSHPDFYEDGTIAKPSRIRYAQEATAADANARDCGGHGTNVASIAAGFNTSGGANFEDAQGFNYGLGVAPRAKLGATKIFNCAGAFDVTTSITALRDFAFARGARISNNSWGANVGGAYDASARELDALVRDARPGTSGNQQMTNVFSAGNSGSGGNTIGSPGTAKNVITVGASENIRSVGFTDGCGVSDAGADNAKDIINFSSRGPTDDGRIKPDIVAPGTHVTGAQPQTGADYNGTGTCNPQFPAGSARYTLVSGTSQAAPEATGFAALITDWYRRTVGGGSTTPSPAMVKALMVNTATDLIGGQDGAGGTNANIPAQIQGWGRINLKNLLDGTVRQFVDQSFRIQATGTSRVTTYTPANTAKPVKVTLVWTDPPGPTTGNAFVNDLDLVVSTLSGTTYKGNVFSAGKSVPGGSADPRNNVENAFLPTSASGPFSVQVRGTNIAGDGVPGNADTTDQDYALVVSNATPASFPALGHDLATPTDTGDGDGFLEPGETFDLRERLRNSGTAAATGISSVLSGPGRTTVTQGTSAYPNIGTGATGSNSTAFRVALAGNYSCGKPAAMTLDLTTAQGPQRVTFSVPTGRPGTGTGPNSTDVPKAIPDNSAPGVDSTLNISGPASSIIDLNVRIGSITHPFDGDLAISLIGPDGTTVSLINRRGSSGDNFTNTVLDDEAATAISAGAAPFTGSFRPEAPLTAFDGRSSNGTWKLHVVDLVAIDTGTINAWGLSPPPLCN
jgi:subtilisin-like proprotein convertase family protein